MGKIKDTYVPVQVRVQKARTQYGSKLSITTSVEFLKGSEGEYEGAIAKAFISNGENLLATGHSFSSDLTSDKAIERLESAAVGRALAFSGFEADSALTAVEETDAEVEETQTLGAPTGLRRAGNLKLGGRNNGTN